MGGVDFQVRPTKYWSDEFTRNLAAIRKKFDPENLFLAYLTNGDQ